MDANYECADCGRRFPVNISPDEMRTVLRNDRTEKCPTCGQRVGVGNVTCGECGRVFPLPMLHWHVRCNVASGVCPQCGERFESLCIC